MKFKGIFGDRSEGQVRWPVVRARLALGVSPSAGVGEPLLVSGSALGLAGHNSLWFEPGGTNICKSWVFVLLKQCS